nr:immunoglobulin heavy chain junction region [Mus musculus]
CARRGGNYNYAMDYW